MLKIFTPNRITVFRIFLSFFILLFLFLENYMNMYFYLSTIWILIILNEATDILDGFIARKYGLVSNIGKVLDPYADVLQHLTYFIFFFYKGITPFYFLIIFMYRELSVGFLRNLIIQFNIVLPASSLGKVKSSLYAFVTVFSLLLFTLNSLNLSSIFDNIFSNYLGINFSLVFVINVIYAFSAFFSLASFSGYLRVFFKINQYEK